ncbi:MAG: WD40 repeat domain-containing protein, partial [Steroidobacteraceae bacterium]
MNVAAARLQPQQRIELDDFPVDAAWSGDGNTLAVAGGEGALLLLSATTSQPPRTIGHHAGGVLALAWQAAGRLLASSGQDGLVRLWDTRSLDSKQLLAAKAWSEHLAFSDNGRLLAVGNARTLHLFDQQGQPQHQFTEHAGVITAIAWRPKSSEIAAVGNGGLQLHRVGSEPQSRAFPWRGAALTASWNADGRMLASGLQDGGVHVWNVAANTGADMPGAGGRVIAAGWSGSGRHLAAAAGNGLVIWEMAKGGQLSRPLQLQAHSERITAMALRPSGSALVSAGRDRRLLL